MTASAKTPSHPSSGKKRKPHTPTSSHHPAIQTTLFKPSPEKNRTQAPPTLKSLKSQSHPSPPPPNYTWDDGTSSFSSYMSAKTAKLRNQFSQQFPTSSSVKTPPLFSGVVIWVDGFTTPSRLQLRSMIGEHGGKLETYFSKECVTHVVAEQLALATRKRLMKGGKGKVNIVRPDWIVESIKCGKRLKERDFQISGLEKGGQSTIDGMFGGKKRGRGKR